MSIKIGFCPALNLIILPFVLNNIIYLKWTLMGIFVYNKSLLSVYFKIKQFMVKETTMNQKIWFIRFLFIHLKLNVSEIVFPVLHCMIFMKVNSVVSNPALLMLKFHFRCNSKYNDQGKILYLQQDRLIYLNDFWTRLPCSRV